jgi:hypothetical protein
MVFSKTANRPGTTRDRLCVEGRSRGEGRGAGRILDDTDADAGAPHATCVGPDEKANWTGFRGQDRGECLQNWPGADTCEIGVGDGERNWGATPGRFALCL